MLISFVAIFGFGFYLAMNIFVALNNDSKLTVIKDQNFPVLEIINESSIILNFVKSALADAVSTGESESIETASQYYEQIVNELGRMKKISDQTSTPNVNIPVCHQHSCMVLYGIFYLK